MPERNRAWWAPRSALSLSRSADSSDPSGSRLADHVGEGLVEVGGVVAVVGDQVEHLRRGLLAQLGDLGQRGDPAADHAGLGQRDLTGGERRAHRGQLGRLLRHPHHGAAGTLAATEDVGEEVLGRGPPEGVGAAGLLESFGDRDQRAVDDRLATGRAWRRPPPRPDRRELSQSTSVSSRARCSAAVAASSAREKSCAQSIEQMFE